MISKKHKKILIVLIIILITILFFSYPVIKILYQKNKKAKITNRMIEESNRNFSLKIEEAYKEVDSQNIFEINLEPGTSYRVSELLDVNDDIEVAIEKSIDNKITYNKIYSRELPIVNDKTKYLFMNDGIIYICVDHATKSTLYKSSDDGITFEIEEFDPTDEQCVFDTPSIPILFDGNLYTIVSQGSDDASEDNLKKIYKLTPEYTWELVNSYSSIDETSD